MLSLKSQISVLDNFVIREESISPVLAMMSKENVEHTQNNTDGSIKDVSKIILSNNFFYSFGLIYYFLEFRHRNIAKNE